MKSMKSVIVVLVKNSLAYVPAFIAHHRRLVDKIILIDHNSDIYLRGLERDGIQTFRISAGFFAQDLFAAYFLKKLRLQKEFDFLFLLDIDEFLPFTSRSEISAFMDENKRSSTIRMEWRNGFTSSGEQLSGKEKLYFTKWRNGTPKLIYNLKRLGTIMPMMGNHNARYPILDSRVVQFRPRRKDSGLGLLHIPFLGLDGLRRKLLDFPAQPYRDKILRDLSALGIEYDAASPDLNLSDEDLMSFAANYRTKSSRIQRDVNLSSFEEIDFLQGLEAEMAELAADLAACPVAPAPPVFLGEDALVAKLRTNRLFLHRQLSSAFSMQRDGTYAFNTPKVE
jgi:hypothetical protein